MTNTSPLPFIWPEPELLNTKGLERHRSQLSFEVAAQSASKVFGIISAIDSAAVNWMEGYLADNLETMLRLVISIHPTCRTTESDLVNLLRLVQRHGDRAQFRVFPESSFLDRSSNLLCFCEPDGSAAISMGPTENMGFTTSSPSQANLATYVPPSTLEKFRKWFDYFWAIAGPLNPEIAKTLPRLILPEGDHDAANLWAEFRRTCLSYESTCDLPVHVTIDPDTCEMLILDHNNEIVKSPTEEIGIAKLDFLSESITQVFELGALVSIDKLSRIPPLEAPVKPEWFGVESFRQTGMVRAQTSIKVAPFDEATLKKIDRLRKVSGELLPRYSFALADGVRWMPKQAIPLFEAALSIANDEAKKLLGATVGDDINSFLNSQSERIRNDAQRMYEAYHPTGTIPENAVANIIDELRIRLDRTKCGKLIPMVAYSPVSFNSAQTSEWSSPWGQAFQLLKGIAEFPREAMTDRFFWQGIRTDEDALIKAMDVAGDYIVKEYGSRKAKQCAEAELTLIKSLEGSPTEAKEKCRAIWTLIKTGKSDNLLAIIDEPA